MHAHVDGDPAAVGAELLGGELLVPLQAGQLGDLAQFAGGDALAQRLQLGDEAPPVPDLEQHSGVLGDPRRLGGLLGADAERLLAQHRECRRARAPRQAPGADQTARR